MSLIRVFEIPPADKMAKGYLFGGGVPVPFVQVDWFRDEPMPMVAENEPQYRGFIGHKLYAIRARERGAGLLILGPQHSFTIGLEAP